MVTDIAKPRPSSSDRKLNTITGAIDDDDLDEDDILNPRNFFNSLYANDNFMKVKERITEDMMQNTLGVASLMRDQKELMHDVAS